MSAASFCVNPNGTRRELLLPPKGAFCVHVRMRAVACGECKKANRRACRYECPDCGLTWMFEEGEWG